MKWSQAAYRHDEDELLFGRAGYLYALLWVRSFVGPAATDFDTALREISEKIIKNGKNIAEKSHPDWPLMWHCFDEPYLGAAHGVIGVLAMLFHCRSLLSAESETLIGLLLDRLVGSRFPSGNLPIQVEETRDEHVHWCHGAPGLPGLLAAAAYAFGGSDAKMRKAAFDASEVIWERGVLTKGYGLCHGISGNGYAFLSLYRWTGESAYLQRAQAFAALLYDTAVQQIIRCQTDPQRKVRGTPDSPRSLMEGDAGVVCFLIDMISPSTSRFPGWEF